MKSWEEKLNTITNISQLIAAAIIVFSFFGTVVWVKYVSTKKIKRVNQ